MVVERDVDADGRGGHVVQDRAEDDPTEAARLQARGQADGEVVELAQQVGGVPVRRCRVVVAQRPADERCDHPQGQAHRHPGEDGQGLLGAEGSAGGHPDHHHGDELRRQCEEDPTQPAPEPGHEGRDRQRTQDRLRRQVGAHHETDEPRVEHDEGHPQSRRPQLQAEGQQPARPERRQEHGRGDVLTPEDGAPEREQHETARGGRDAQVGGDPHGVLIRWLRVGS